MNAKEANLIAKAKQKSEFYESLYDIMDSIKLNATHGYFEIKYWKSISIEVKEHLLNLGYILSDSEYGYTLINWKL